MAPAMSIRCMTVPPRMYPSGFASLGSTTCTISVALAEAGFGVSSAMPPGDRKRTGPRASFLEVLRVLLRVVLPLLGDLVAREDRLDRTGRHAGTAVDALIRVDVQLVDGGKLGLVLARVDAVDRADIHA